jgi:hypothetical protein
MKRLIAGICCIILSGLCFTAPAHATPYGSGCYGANSNSTVGSRSNYGNSHPVGDVQPAGGNGVINIFDLSYMLTHYGESSTTGLNCELDVTVSGSNIINLFDLSYLLAHYGESS